MDANNRIIWNTGGDHPIYVKQKLMESEKYLSLEPNKTLVEKSKNSGESIKGSTS